MGQRFEGKNVDEALTSAAETLGVGRYQLTYHVLLEKRGFLGGMKRAVIEAEVNEGAAEPPPPPQSALPLAGEGGARSTSSGQAPRRVRADGESRPRERGGRERGGRGGRGRSRREDRGPREEPFTAASEPVDIPEQGLESENAAKARAWAEQLLSLAKLDLVIRTDETDEKIYLRLYGRDSQRLTDRNGELLDALQVLANKALTGRAVEKDLEFDCAAFKERRIEELGQRARATADRVRRDGREELLPAMSPIERRIVHLALQDDQDVMTESRGDGFYKRVAIKPRPAGEPAQPES